MELQDIILDYRNKLSKDELFNLIYRLKYNLEMNSSIFEPEHLYYTVCDIYTDNAPLYQNDTYSPDIVSYTKTYNLEDLSIEDKIKNVFRIIDDLNDVKKRVILVHDFDYNGNIFKESRQITFDVNNSNTENNVIINDLFEEALNNPDDIYVFILDELPMTKQEIISLFTYRIIPPNVVLPKRFVNMVYISDYFYNEKLKQYYKVDENRETIVITDIKKQRIYREKFQQVYINRDTAIIDKTIYINECSKLIKKLYE